MKKNLFMVAAVALMAFAACNKEEINDGAKPSYYVEFVAEAANEEAQPDSKTTYDQNNKKTLWENGDAISVNGKRFETNELSEGGLSARFVNTDELGESFGSPFLAVSPYQEGYVVNNTTVSGIVLDSEQTATAASFESDAIIALAYSSENTLEFKNVCSMVQFKVGTSDVKEVTIVSNNGEYLAGTITVDYNNGKPKVTEVINGSPSITLTGTFNTTDTYYVAVLASGLENGITIRINGTIAKTVANELAFERNTVMKAGTLSLSPTSPSSTQKVYLKGAWNGWNESTPMYFESGLYVARNVPMTGEFKVHSDAWYGGSSAKTDAWFDVADGDNLKLSSYNGNYDVYFSQDNKKLYITAAGSAAPSVWGVWVNGVSKDYSMTQVGEYFVAKSVELSASQNFKYRTFSDWGVNKGYGTIKSKTAYSLNDNGKDMNVATTGTYDIYLTANGAYGFVVPAGHSLNDSDILVSGKSIIGNVDGSNWNKDLEMYVCGDYFGRKNVVCAGEFKIRQDKTWENSPNWGSNNNDGTLNQGGGNIKATGTYNILVDHNFSKYYLK